MRPKISLKWDNFSSYLFPPTLSTDIAMQRCILGNIFDNHIIKFKQLLNTNKCKHRILLGIKFKQV